MIIRKAYFTLKNRPIIKEIIEVFNLLHIEHPISNKKISKNFNKQWIYSKNFNIFIVVIHIVNQLSIIMKIFITKLPINNP